MADEALMRLAERLTERDIEIAAELIAAADEAVRFQSQGYAMRDWFRPLDIGGYNGSDHSYRLSKLEKSGLVVARQRMAHMSRGSKEYRPTEVLRIALRSRANQEATHDNSH
jgi:hypothetical protein